MVEMAVCFPIFMLMLFGIIEFGRGLMVAQLLTNAAREGCRSAIVDGASNATVQASVTSDVVNTVDCASTDVTVTITVTSLANGTAITDISAAEPRDLIEIDVAVPFDAISYAAGRYLGGNLLRGQCAMRKE